MSFSKRQDLKNVRQEIQFESMDKDLRTSLWNALTLVYWSTFCECDYAMDSEELYSISTEENETLHRICIDLYLHYFINPIDELGDDWLSIKQKFKNYFFSCQWFEVYDFIEYISQNYEIAETNQEFRKTCNRVLQAEMSAYRFVDDIIAPIVELDVIEVIEKAVAYRDENVSQHLKRALELFSDRRKPDYRNSIKESISAVESLLKNITGKNDSLGKLLNVLDNKLKLHSSLKTSLSNLYGYASDVARHGIKDEDLTDFDDAKFMLVTCSAYVNYLRAKSKNGI